MEILRYQILSNWKDSYRILTTTQTFPSFRIPTATGLWSPLLSIDHDGRIFSMRCKAEELALLQASVVRSLCISIIVFFFYNPLQITILDYVLDTNRQYFASYWSGPNTICYIRYACFEAQGFSIDDQWRQRDYLVTCCCANFEAEV
ncbi:hypothetical protein Droror1_Dr00004279 [Drosera rotundifolia]